MRLYLFRGLALGAVLALPACSSEPETQADRIAQANNSALMSGALRPSKQGEPIIARKDGQILSPTTQQMKDLEFEQGLPSRASSVTIERSAQFRTLSQASAAGEKGVPLAAPELSLKPKEDLDSTPESSWFSLVKVGALGLLLAVIGIGVVAYKRFKGAAK